MRVRAKLLLTVVVLLLATRRAPAQDRKVEPPPPLLKKDLGLSAFYKKHVNAGGIPVLGSGRVSDAALLEAADIVDHMLAGRDDVRRAIANNHVRVAVMAVSEFTTDVPEHSGFHPRRYWNRRYRGIGATTPRPAVSCGEENLLSSQGDPYVGESLFVHEFGHAVHEMGVRALDPEFDARLRSTYEAALAAGLWKGTYAGQSPTEYWAEGVQSWFDANRENDREHNSVGTRAKLKEYDPRFARLLSSVFGDKEWRFKPIPARSAGELEHLHGFQPEKAPRFEWPRELADPSALDLTLDDDGKPLPRVDVARAAGAALASPQSDRPTRLVLVNRRGTDVLLQWVGFDGKLHSFARARPGEAVQEETFTGHVWAFTDEGGAVLGVATASEAPAQAVLEPSNVKRLEVKHGDMPRASPSSERVSAVVFLNRRPEHVRVEWLDDQGELKPLATLGPGERRRQESLAGHIWKLSSEDGRSLGFVAAVEEEGEARIEPKPGVLPALTLAPRDSVRVSPRTEKPTEILFVNKSNRTVTVDWLDFDGGTKTYATLEPRGTHKQSTFAGHHWVISTRGGSSPALVATAEESPAQAVIE